MLIVVIAGGEDQKEFQDKEIPEGVQVQFVNSLDEAREDADAYFYLLKEPSIESMTEKISSLQAPVFIKGDADLKSLPKNVSKISPWPGFLFAESIKVSLFSANVQQVTDVFNKLQWKHHHKLVS